MQKVFASTLFEDLMGEARSMSSDDMVFYTNMVMNAYKKMEELNEAIPK